MNGPMFPDATHPFIGRGTGNTADAAQEAAQELALAAGNDLAQRLSYAGGNFESRNCRLALGRVAIP